MLKIYQKKHMIRTLNLEAIFIMKKSGLIAKTLRQKGIASSKTSFFGFFIYYSN